MKAFAANLRDFSGSLNPTGAWSPAFHMLKQAVGVAAPTPVLEMALYAWLDSIGVSEQRLDDCLDLPADEALAEFARLARLGGERMSADDKSAIQQAFTHVFTARLNRRAGDAVAAYTSTMDKIGTQRRTHGLGESAARIVEVLLS